MSKELATTGSFALAPVDAGTLAAIKEELDGLGTVPFDTIKIPSGGGIAFEVPGDDPDSPEMVKELTGVILHHHPSNSWWRDAYTGGNTPPDCASSDGKIGVMAESGELRDCATCPMNQFGSDGNGKACKNIHRLYILREGEVLPSIFSVPPTSLKNFKDYLAKRVVLRGKRAYQVITKITLKKAQSSGGITYSQAVFTSGGDLAPEQSEAVMSTVEMVKAMAAAQAQQPTQPVADAPLTEVVGDGKLPF